MAWDREFYDPGSREHCIVRYPEELKQGMEHFGNIDVFWNWPTWTKTGLDQRNHGICTGIFMVEQHNCGLAKMVTNIGYTFFSSWHEAILRVGTAREKRSLKGMGQGLLANGSDDRMRVRVCSPDTRASSRLWYYKQRPDSVRKGWLVCKLTPRVLAVTGWHARHTDARF